LYGIKEEELMGTMDRKIEKKRMPLKRLIPIIGICVVTIFLAYQVWSRSGETRLKVDPSRMTISKVIYDEFSENYPFEGTVEPVTSVYLDIEVGGRVEEIFVEGGQPIQKGDLILRFSNAGMQRTFINTENSLLENLDRQRNTQFQLAQSKLAHKETLLNLDYRILEMEKKYKRYQALKEETVISEEQYEDVKDELRYMKDRRDLLEERIRQENLLSEKQLEQANKSIERLNISLDLLAKAVESLDFRAPISGHLSSIDAEIGWNINPGTRIGQIDLLDNFKIRAGIEQYYLSRVAVGTKGRFSLDGAEYEVEVKKIDPEVTPGGVCYVDMVFLGEPPKGIKRGQRLTIELSFSESEERLQVKKGGFYQQTGGRWVYLISEDGKSAYRADIRVGRENPRSLEVLEGLKEGDWIITSGYDTFKEADTLIFKEPLDLT
jgi:HlyD family secretion protein